MTGPHPLRLILMCGLPGAGKTTLARRRAEEVPAVRLCTDEGMAHLGIDLYDEATRERLEARFRRHAQDLLPLGMDVTMESGFWLRSDGDEKRLGARALGAWVELRYLDVPRDTLWRSIERRNATGAGDMVPITRANLDTWATSFQALDSAEAALFDAPAEVSGQ